MSTTSLAASFKVPATATGSQTPATLTGTGFADGANVKGPSGATFSSVTVDSAPTISAVMKTAASATTASGMGITVTNSAAAGYWKVTADLLAVALRKHVKR